ncbi:MAG: hypothetical protein C4557_13030 [Anaerolineaceae bacterium]|nr:MAG: hypothetical protein C4557_13030 [Anaerolineaceae bacterium]
MAIRPTRKIFAVGVVFTEQYYTARQILRRSTGWGAGAGMPSRKKRCTDVEQVRELEFQKMEWEQEIAAPIRARNDIKERT